MAAAPNRRAVAVAALFAAMSTMVGRPTTQVAAAGIGIPISAPDISPDNGTFTGNVEVFLINNAEASTMHYTLDGSLPTEKSPEYRDPFYIQVVGEVLLRAVAVSDIVNRPDSPPVARRYVVKPSDEIPVEIDPSAGMFVGKASFRIRGGGSIVYWTDLDTTRKPYTGRFTIDTVGDRVVYARRTADGAPTSYSHVRIAPRPAFDVSRSGGTPAEKDLEPRRCSPFRIWLQGIEDGSRVFLTTSRRGCDTLNHLLDDTDAMSVDTRYPSIRFASRGDAGKVYVCAAPPDAPEAAVRLTRLGMNQSYFELLDAVDESKCAKMQVDGGGIATSGAPQVVTSVMGRSTETTGALIGHLVLWGIILAAVALSAHWMLNRGRSSSSSG